MHTFVKNSKRSLCTLLLPIILSSTLLSSCIKPPSGLLGSLDLPDASPSISNERSSPAPTEQSVAPSPSYTDLPVIECSHETDDEEVDYANMRKVYSKINFYTFDLAKEDASALLEILNGGLWAEGEAEIDSEYYLIAGGNGNLCYSTKGIFSDRGRSRIQKRHLVLTDRQRDTVNGILAKYTKEPVVLEDQSDPSAVFEYLKDILDRDSMPYGKRTDFPNANLAEQVSKGMSYENLSALLSSPHFSYRIGGTRKIEPYIDYYILSDGSVFEVRLKVNKDDNGKQSTGVSAYTVMTAREFLTRYGLDPADTPKGSLSDLRRALPLCYSIGFLEEGTNLAHHLGHTADRTRNDLSDAQKADQIKEGMYAGQVFALLGHPHLSLENTTNSGSLHLSWFALSDGSFLQVQYKAHSQRENDPHEEAREEWGISEDAPIYTVRSVQKLTLSQVLDYALYDQSLYPWQLFDAMYGY